MHGPPERQKEEDNPGYTTVPLGELAWVWDDNNPWKREEKTCERSQTYRSQS